MARTRETYDIRGRTVLITGAARGIGFEAARRLYAHGANLALVGLEPELLEQRAAELGPRAAAFEADVTDWDALQTAVDGTVERFGGIDVTIANAGLGAVGSVMGQDIASFERTIEVNLLGVWRTNRVVLPHVVERRGYILNIASLAAIAHAPLMAPYTASKAGVEAFSDALRQEVAPTGTDVGVAYFGFIDTDLVRDSFDHPATTHMRKKAGDNAFTRPIPLSRSRSRPGGSRPSSTTPSPPGTAPERPMPLIPRPLRGRGSWWRWPASDSRCPCPPGSVPAQGVRARRRRPVRPSAHPSARRPARPRLPRQGTR